MNKNLPHPDMQPRGDRPILPGHNDYSNKKALMINQNIISVDSNNKEYVYKLYTKNNKDYVSKTTIETGKNDGKNIEVISGLSQGDLIVSEGIRKLVDNSRVKIIK